MRKMKLDWYDLQVIIRALWETRETDQGYLECLRIPLLFSLLDVQETIKRWTKRKKILFELDEKRLVTRVLLDFRNKLLCKGKEGPADLLGELILRFNC